MANKLKAMVCYDAYIGDRYSGNEMMLVVSKIVGAGDKLTLPDGRTVVVETVCHSDSKIECRELQ